MNNRTALAPTPEELRQCPVCYGEVKENDEVTTCRWTSEDGNVTYGCSRQMHRGCRSGVLSARAKLCPECVLYAQIQAVGKHFPSVVLEDVTSECSYCSSNRQRLNPFLVCVHCLKNSVVRQHADWLAKEGVWRTETLFPNPNDVSFPDQFLSLIHI